jgi:hypothetical protein
MSSFIGQIPTFSCQQVVMKYYYGWLKIGWKVKLEVIVFDNIVIPHPPQKELYKEWQIMLD